MLDKIILGLLTKKDLTTYDIKTAMEKSISKFYSNSFGSINPAIKKLEKINFIAVTESIENGRFKKTYHITQQGTLAYQNWISEPIKQGRLKDEVLIRIFFLGDSDKSEQKRLIMDYLVELNKSKELLGQTQKGIDQLDLSPKEEEQIKFQVSTLQFGIDYISFKQKWFEDLLDTL